MMGKVKLIWNILDSIFGTFLGLTLIEVFGVFSFGLFTGTGVGTWVDDIDGIIKLLMATVGLVYFFLRGIHNFKMNRLDREEKRLSILMKKEELEGMEIDNEKKTE